MCGEVKELLENKFNGKAVDTKNKNMFYDCSGRLSVNYASFDKCDRFKCKKAFETGYESLGLV